MTTCPVEIGVILRDTMASSVASTTFIRIVRCPFLQADVRLYQVVTTPDHSKFQGPADFYHTWLLAYADWGHLFSRDGRASEDEVVALFVGRRVLSLPAPQKPKAPVPVEVKVAPVVLEVEVVESPEVESLEEKYVAVSPLGADGPIGGNLGGDSFPEEKTAAKKEEAPKPKLGRPKKNRSGF